jgi:hypothetical protein
LFLSVASVCLAAALIAVPFGRVIIADGSGALTAGAAFAAAAGLAAAGFLAAPAVSSAGLFEQPTPPKTTPAAKTSQRLLRIWELNI